jgi:hypothetical protein
MSFKLKQFSTAEGTEHENTTTEGSIATKSFAAGELLPGKVYGFSCGVIVNDNNSTDTLIARVRFGTSDTVTSNTEIAVGSNAVDVADGDVAWVRGEIHVQSATRYVFHATVPDIDASGSIGDKSSVKVFDATANTAYRLDVTLDWSVAHADNEAAAASFAVWEIA